MTRTCWRIMACMLTLGLGGFAVLAEDDANPSPTFVARRAGASLPNLPVPVAPAQAMEVTADPHTIAMTPVPVPVVPPVNETPVAAVPQPDSDAHVLKFSSGEPVARGQDLPPAIPVAAPPPPPPPYPVIEMPKPSESPPVIAPIANPLPPEPVAAPRNFPQTTLTGPPAPVAPSITVPMPEVPAVPRAAVAEPHSAAPFPWKLCLDVVGGLTQLEVKRNDELLMKVQCTKLDLHAPSGGIHASGSVVVSGPCVEARCDRLMIAWQNGQVALDGGVRMTFQSRSGTVHEMRAESVTFRLTGANSPVDFTAREVQQIVSPPKP